jgi:tetratricopeptide (TPR) repeat protein
MHKKTLIILTVVAMFACVLSVEALSQTEASRAVERAQVLWDSGRTSEGIDLLKKSLNNCETGEHTKKCRPLLNYSLGYLTQRTAKNDPVRSTELLKRAEVYYLEVLEDLPNHGPTLNNIALIYSKTGRMGEAARLLERALRSDPLRNNRYRLSLGDILYAQGKYRMALAHYQQAAEGDPLDPIPVSRMMDVYEHLLTNQYNTISVEISGRLKIWEKNFPETAERGYVALLAHGATRDDPKQMERYFLDLVGLLGRHRRLTKERLAKIPATVENKAVHQLTAYASNPRALGSWWTAEQIRRHVLGLAALAFGHTDLKKKGPEAAEKRWEIALDRVVPNAMFYYQDFPHLTQAPLQLMTELAALYHQYPDLDSKNKKFKKLIVRIFKSKSLAYRSKDLDSIQSHHMVLGYIYTRDPDKEEAIWQPANAVFQLTHALQISKIRFLQTGKYEPLPLLKEMLAESCQNPTPAARRQSIRDCMLEQCNFAGTMYLEAAKAYMDTDQLKKANQMLNKAEDTYLNEFQHAAHGQISDIQNLRRRIKGAPEDQIAEITANLLKTHKLESTMFGDDPLYIEHEFLQRQRFKIMADLTYKLEQASPEKSILQGLLAGIRLFVEKSTENVVLSGTADEIRMIRLNKQGFKVTLSGDYPMTQKEAKARWVQYSLNRILEKKLSVDGIHGNNTMSAIRLFQVKFDLPVKSRVEPIAERKMKSLLCEGF